MTSKLRDWDGLISTLRRKQKPIKYEIEKHQRSQPMNIAVGPDEPEGKNQRMIHVGLFSRTFQQTPGVSFAVVWVYKLILTLFPLKILGIWSWFSFVYKDQIVEDWRLF